MSAPESQISKNDVQLYLLGELTGEKAIHIEKVDASDFENLHSVGDQEIKTTLAKIRQVDKMLQHAADTSYPMPPTLENKIDSLLAIKNTAQKKTPLSISERLRSYFTTSNLWSLASGAVAASLGMITLIQIQPDLLIHPNFIQTEEMVFRGTGNVSSDVPDECLFLPQKSWIVTEQFLLQIPVCSPSGDKSALTNNTTVAIGDKFQILLLPIEDNVLSITYESQDGQTTRILENENVKKGHTLQLPVSEHYTFSKPIGSDKISFSTNSGYRYTLRFNVN